MESENKQQQRNQKKISDGIFYLNKAIKRIVWTSNLVVWYFKYGKKIASAIGDLIISSWLGLILIAIWTDNAMYYKIAFTILVAGAVLMFFGKALMELFSKPKRAEKKPPLSESSQNMMIMSILMDKLKNDEGYRKEVAKKFYDDLMEKKSERAEGEQEPKE